MLFNEQFYILRLCSVFCFVDFARFPCLEQRRSGRLSMCLAWAIC